MNFKKLLSMGLAGAMILGALSGCGNSEPAGDTSAAGAETNVQETTADAQAAGDGAAVSSEEATDWEEEPAEVTWMMWNVGGTVNEQGIQAVEDAVNEITLKKINVKVNLETLEMGAYLSQMPMQVGANDKIDLITTFPAAAGRFNTMVNAGQLLPLDELLNAYAPETLELLPENLLNGTTIDGQIYGVPVHSDKTNDLHWICRESYLTEAGFTVDDIKSLDDITKVFEKVYELHPDMKMISSGAKNLLGSAGVLITGTTLDTLGTNVAAVMLDEDTAKVVSFYETDAYKEVAGVLRDWSEKGYVDKDIMIREDDPTADTTVFSFLLAGNASRTAGNEDLAGEPLVSVKLTEGYVSTGTVTNTTMAIPVCATEPEAAAKLLNLCYTDKELKMLVSYGIEGENYTINDAGAVVVNTSSGYAPNTGGIFGNVMLCNPSEQEVAMGYDMAAVDQSVLKYSPLLGFSVDTDPITNEAAALSSVYTEYQALMDCGMADEATYQEFIDKLYANGLEKYLAEIQKQLDAWLANQ